MYKTLISLILWPVWYMVTLTCVLIYLIAFLVFNPQKLHPLARVLSYIIMAAGGQWLRISGQRPDPEKGPYLYLFNHESMFDVFMIAAAVPRYISAVGANRQFSWPVWGFLIRRYGVIPIKRRKLNEAIRSLEKAEEAIRNGISFMIAPEGTRTLDGAMGEFKKGPFHLALNSKVTIIPIGIKNAYRAKHKTDWRLTPGVLELKFGDPIPASQYGHMSVEELRDLVCDKISKLRE
jgi:1-acyl-sn-glycerol-3-phosphate acyltransferase